MIEPAPRKMKAKLPTSSATIGLNYRSLSMLFFRRPEGDWQPQRFVIWEFENAEQLKRWYHSPEYGEIRTIRFQASTTRVILAPGVEEPPSF